MKGFLIDEMFPRAVAVMLREEYGHDALHVAEIGLLATEDALVSATARAAGRAVVTENVRDFARERDVVLVFILKRNLPVGSALSVALARILDEWAQATPDPYLGAHWPQIN